MLLRWIYTCLELKILTLLNLQVIRIQKYTEFIFRIKKIQSIELTSGQNSKVYWIYKYLELKWLTFLNLYVITIKNNDIIELQILEIQFINIIKFYNFLENDWY